MGLPLAAAIVAVLFAAALARDFLARRRSYQAIWSAAMLMYAAASAAVALGAANGWTSGEFRVYWVLGAVLNVLSSRRVSSTSWSTDAPCAGRSTSCSRS